MLLRAAARYSGRRSSPALRITASQTQWCRHYAKDDKPHRAVPKSPSHLRAAESLQNAPPKGPVQNRTWGPDRPIKFAQPASQAKPTEGGTVLENEAVPGAVSTSKNQPPIDAENHPIITPPPPKNAMETEAGPRSATVEETSSQQPIITPPPPNDAVEFREMPKSATEEASKREGDSSQQPVITPSPPTDHIHMKESLKTPPPSVSSEPELRKSTLPESSTFDAQSTNQQNTAASQEVPDQAGTPASPTGSLPDLRHGIPSSFESEFSDRSSSFKDKDAEPPSLDITEDPARADRRRGRDEPEDYYTSIDRRRITVARWAYIAFGAFAVSGAFYLGQNWSEEEVRLHPDAPNGWDPKSFYARIKERVAPTLGYYTEPTFPKLLPDVDPSLRISPYTLVLSLEDLLVSSSWNRNEGWKVAKRPGVDYFIRYMQQYYELAVFTTVQSMNADLVIRKLDPFRLISWPLYREATRYMKGEHVKDLSYLNRDLSKVIIIDTVPGHVQLQPENAIILPKWNGNSTDSHSNDLVALIPFLEYIASMSIDDVRKVLKSYEGKHIPTEFHRREQLARETFNKKLEEEKARRGGRAGGTSIWGSLGSSLGIKPTPMAQIPGEQSPAEALQQGKMLSDQIRERGLKNYEHIEREIQLHGAEWLKEAEREEKKFQEEQMKSMQSGMTGMFSGWFGGGSSSGGGDGKS